MGAAQGHTYQWKATCTLRFSARKRKALRSHGRVGKTTTLHLRPHSRCQGHFDLQHSPHHALHTLLVHEANDANVIAPYHVRPTSTLCTPGNNAGSAQASSLHIDARPRTDRTVHKKKKNKFPHRGVRSPGQSPVGINYMQASGRQSLQLASSAHQLLPTYAYGARQPVGPQVP